MIEVLLVLAILALIGANALFVAAEFAFVSVDRPTVERAARAGDDRAEGLLQALRSLSTQLSGAQLGITVTSLVVGFLVEPALGHVLASPLSAAGLPEGAAVGAGAALALALATVFQMVLGELVPKNWAIAEPLRVGRRVAGPQRAFTSATRWLITALNGAANALLRLLGIEPQEELRSARRPQELVAIAARSSQLGALDAGTAEMLGRAVEFADRTAVDIMTPRARVHFLSAAEPVSQVLEAVAANGHARYPVMGENFDDVVGAVHFKHALAVPRHRRASTPIETVMKEVAVVPESVDLNGLLDVLRRPGWQLAVVTDEYGGTAGIVTLEDLVEELVGEIADEHDPDDPSATRLPDDSWSVDALLRPDEVRRLTSLNVPDPEHGETLAGLVQERLGRLAEEGDQILVEEAGGAVDGVPATLELRVLRLDGLRIERLGLARVAAGSDGHADE